MTGHHLVNVLPCGATLFMFLAPHVGGVAMTAAGTAGAGAVVLPPLVVMLALAMAGWAVVTMDRFAARAPVRAGPVIGSRLRASCQVTMGLAMTCMLVQML